MRWTFLLVHVTLLSVVAKKKKKRGGPPPKPKEDEGPCQGMGFYSKQIAKLCAAHYPPDDKTQDVWVVQFYTQNNREVLEARLPYEGLGMTLGKTGEVKIGAVDCSMDAHLNVGFCVKQDISIFPTTRVIIQGHKYDYSGLHNLDSLTRFVQVSRERLANVECKVKGLFDEPRKDFVAPLCTETFPPKFSESIPWIVAFYEEGDRKWDKVLKSSLNKIAEKYHNHPPLKERDQNVKEKKVRISVGAVECGDRKQDCGQFEVTKFPTLRFYESTTKYTSYDEKSFKADKLKTWGDDLLRESLRPKHKQEEEEEDDEEEAEESEGKKEEL